MGYWGLVSSLMVPPRIHVYWLGAVNEAGVSFWLHHIQSLRVFRRAWCSAWYRCHLRQSFTCGVYFYIILQFVAIFGPIKMEMYWPQDLHFFERDGPFMEALQTARFVHKPKSFFKLRDNLENCRLSDLTDYELAEMLERSGFLLTICWESALLGVYRRVSYRYGGTNWGLYHCHMHERLT